MSGLVAQVRKMRDSLLAIPALMILAGAVAAWITTGVEKRSDPGSAPLVLTSTIDGTRTILGTLAGATITVAAVVFSIMAVSVQLSATQYSPRVTRGFLRDRFQQTVIGLVVGTFTFSLVALGTLPPGGAVEPTDAAGWTAFIAITLGSLTALGIVAFVDHINRRVRIDSTVRRLTSETVAAFERMAERPRSEAQRDVDERPWSLAPETSQQVVQTDAAGWVTGIDVAGLAEMLPDGAIARIEPPVGAYVNAGDPVITVWTAAPAPLSGQRLERAAASITVEPERSIERDPPFGIRQLVDISLRALSPGVNDPTTAADVVRQLVGPLRMALDTQHRSGVFAGARGVRVYRPAEPSGIDLVRRAYSEVRRAAGTHPMVYAALLGSLASLRFSAEHADRPLVVAALEEEIAVTELAVEEAGFAVNELSRLEGWGRRERDERGDSPG